MCLSGCTYPLPSCSELQSKVLHSAPAPNYRCLGRWESVERKMGSWSWMPSDKWNLVRHWLGRRLRLDVRIDVKLPTWENVSLDYNRNNFSSTFGQKMVQIDVVSKEKKWKRVWQIQLPKVVYPPINTWVLTSLTLLTSSSYIFHIHTRNMASTGICKVFS